MHVFYSLVRKQQTYVVTKYVLLEHLWCLLRLLLLCMRLLRLPNSFLNALKHAFFEAFLKSFAKHRIEGCATLHKWTEVSGEFKHTHVRARTADDTVHTFS